MNPKQKSTILITCSAGLVDFLQQEVKQLGFAPQSPHKTGLEVQGDQLDAMLLNLHLRTAYNVLFLLKQFPCNSPEELYREVSKLPWEQMIPPDEYLSVVSRVDAACIDNTMFASLKVKDAIVDRIVQHTGSRPDSGKDKTGVVIHLFWKKNRCWLYLNTSGQKISDRGYRKIPHKAPLRESLAAAIIQAAGYDGSQALVCPMCGSGTLPIEAALIASRRAPGLLRSNFGFMHMKYFDDSAWQQMRSAAQKQSKKRGGKAAFKPAPIIATDIDPDAVDAARKNALTAGVTHLIDFDICDFADTNVPDLYASESDTLEADTPENTASDSGTPGKNGIILMNPEYGSRMGEIEDLKKTYERIGDFFKQKCTGYTGYIFTGNPDLAKKVHLRTSRRIPFFNANIECRLLKFELYSGSQKNRPEADD